MPGRFPFHPYSHQTPVRVFYGDTDKMGVAYYANYLRWFEMARNEYMRNIGYSYARLESEGLALPVVDVGCRYRKPARYDDELTLESWIAGKSAVRVRFEYRIWNAAHASAITEGFTVHASLNLQGRPTRLPAGFLDLLTVPSASSTAS